MKTIIKLTLVLCLFGSVAFAGDMPGGGRQCPPEGCTPPPCTVDCGGSAQLGDENAVLASEAIVTTTDVVIDLVKDTLEFLF